MKPSLHESLDVRRSFFATSRSGVDATLGAGWGMSAAAVRAPLAVTEVRLEISDWRGKTFTNGGGVALASIIALAIRVTRLYMAALEISMLEKPISSMAFV
jgi:hypothetical protein